MGIFIKHKKCDACAFVKTGHTPGSGYGTDYFCSKKNNKKVAGYVEWDSELPLIPNWCPLKLAEEIFEKAVEIAGDDLQAVLLTDPNKDLREFSKKLFKKGNKNV